MILSIFEHSIDLKKDIIALIGNCEIVVPKTVLNELYLISTTGKGRKKIKAKSAIKYVKENFRIIENEGAADTSIISLAREIRGIVATNDRKLRKELRNNSIPVLFLREKKKLMLDGIV